ncbi:uncharacterized protein M437DRAFT_78000 [Aureobasidium melanogenum CBS 110374]|uniref:Aminoglycoside phosphotransferase domain-containing protein n=1 Tax=Aureobasidium melanogenum (strain CBS 110374) TaxID=1043003 RepID=A0A074WAK5_AURM1|nr:uncharacterized protein M437DRAFT_78000 [Aureobasidium melanogenum CBS 110374]KEQ59546.1 hypothetical protein M437DRAFT_78000 [Aureobasidium melanogenum CBS 110374]
MKRSMWPCDFSQCNKPATRVLGDCVICGSHLCYEHLQERSHTCPSPQDQDYDQQLDKAEENEIAQLLHRINFEQLELRASSVRNNIPCRVEMPKNDKDSRWSMMGGMNLHVRIIFEDKVCWIARIRRSNATSPPSELRDRIFMSEIQTLLFLQTTNIPTPKVWDYALEGPENPVRVGYILMDCMPGKSLDRFSLSEEGRDKIIAQIADIYLQLREFPFDRIGSIEQADEKHVGPLARECFTDFTDSGIRPLGPFSDLQSYYKASIQLLLDLIHRGEIHADRPTYLKHADDKGSHILVDEEMNITGIIDWEWAFTTTEHLAFNSPMLLLPTWDFFQGLGRIGEEEQLFAKCLEAKGASDMASFVREGRKHHQFAFLCTFDLGISFQDLQSLFGGLLNSMKGVDGHSWEEWRQQALKQFDQDPRLTDILSRSEG